MDCSFCYLSKEERSDKLYSSIDDMEAKLVDLIKYRSIDHIDLYGGEVALLPPQYLRDLFSLFKKYKQPDARITVITNFLKLNPAIMEEPDIDLSVSYDFNGRERSDVVLNNMINSTRDINVLTLGTKEVLAVPPKIVVATFNFIERVKTLEIKPYSPNQCNEHDIADNSFENFVINIAGINKNFEFINESWAKRCVSGQYNAYSDNHLYITPTLDYAVLDFDEDDNEYFRTMKSFEEYVSWTEQEKMKVQSLPHCSSCEYIGRCMTEHYKTACSGYPTILDWVQNNK